MSRHHANSWENPQQEPPLTAKSEESTEGETVSRVIQAGEQSVSPGAQEQRPRPQAMGVSWGILIKSQG